MKITQISIFYYIFIFSTLILCLHFFISFPSNQTNRRGAKSCLLQRLDEVDLDGMVKCLHAFCPLGTSPSSTLSKCPLSYLQKQMRVNPISWISIRFFGPSLRYPVDNNHYPLTPLPILPPSSSINIRTI